MLVTCVIHVLVTCDVYMIMTFAIFPFFSALALVDQVDCCWTATFFSRRWVARPVLQLHQSVTTHLPPDKSTHVLKGCLTMSNLLGKLDKREVLWREPKVQSKTLYILPTLQMLIYNDPVTPMDNTQLLRMTGWALHLKHQHINQSDPVQYQLEPAAEVTASVVVPVWQ